MIKRKKKVVKKVTKKPVKKAAKKNLSSDEFNRATHWKAYKALQARADKAWAKFQADAKKKAKPEVIAKDHRELLLILGECDYMAREYVRIAASK